MRLLVPLAAPLSILILYASVAGSLAPGRLERWVRSGLQSLQWDQLDRCLRMSLLSEAECRRLAHLPLSAVAVYLAEPRTAAGREGRGSPSLGSFCLIYPEMVWCVYPVRNTRTILQLNNFKMCLKLEMEVFQKNPVFYVVSVIELIYGCRSLTRDQESKFAVYNLNDTNYITYIKDPVLFVLY